MLHLTDHVGHVALGLITHFLDLLRYDLNLDLADTGALVAYALDECGHCPLLNVVLVSYYDEVCSILIASNRDLA